MPIAFQCPHCKADNRAYDHLVGRTVKCAKCGKMFQIPAIGAGSPPAYFVDSVSNKPKPPPAARPAPSAAPLGPAPGIAPLAPAPLAPAAAFEQDLQLTDDMLAAAAPAAPAGPPAAPVEEFELTEDMVIEEAPAKAGQPASPEELAMLEEIILEEAPPEPPKKK